MSNETKPFFILDKQGESELIIKKSRFLGFSEPLRSESSSEEELRHIATQRIVQIRKQFHDARHVCFAYRIRKQDLTNQLYEKYSDDGEPIRTGGFPILQLLQGEELENSVSIVVRYFGGVKLGPGGLARAYRDCARQSIEMSGRLEIVPQTLLEYEIQYDLLASMEHWIQERPDIRIKEKVFAEKVGITFEIRSDRFGPQTKELAAFLQIPLQTLAKEDN